MRMAYGVRAVAVGALLAGSVFATSKAQAWNLDPEMDPETPVQTCAVYGEVATMVARLYYAGVPQERLTALAEGRHELFRVAVEKAYQLPRHDSAAARTGEAVQLGDTLRTACLMRAALDSAE